mgnify:CR=1 FL=1
MVLLIVFGASFLAATISIGTLVKGSLLIVMVVPYPLSPVPVSVSVRVPVCVCVCVCPSARARVCVCVYEREGERERLTAFGGFSLLQVAVVGYVGTLVSLTIQTHWWPEIGESFLLGTVALGLCFPSCARWGCMGSSFSSLLLPSAPQTGPRCLLCSFPVVFVGNAFSGGGINIFPVIFSKVCLSFCGAEI